MLFRSELKKFWKFAVVMRRHQFHQKSFTQEKENIKKDRIEKSPKAVGAFFFLRQALKRPGFCEKFHKQHAEGGK